jgi:hypothetical protein
MTKNTKLVWRLGKLPTVDEIKILIDNKIITQEEAREILFNQETVEDRDKESLKEEVKFLREMVDKLAEKQEIARTIRILPRRETPWFKYYEDWMINPATFTSMLFRDISTF